MKRGETGTQRSPSQAQTHICHSKRQYQMLEFCTVCKYAADLLMDHMGHGRKISRGMEGYLSLGPGTKARHKKIAGQKFSSKIWYYGHVPC